MFIIINIGDNYVLETHLIKGKKLSSSNLLKALSTYFKL